MKNSILEVSSLYDIETNLILYIEDDVNNAISKLRYVVTKLATIDEQLKDGWTTANSADFLTTELTEPNYTEQVSAYITGLADKIGYIAEKIKEYNDGEHAGLNLEGIVFKNQEEYATLEGAGQLGSFGANLTFGVAKFFEGALGTVEGIVDGALSLVSYLGIDTENLVATDFTGKVFNYDEGLLKWADANRTMSDSVAQFIEGAGSIAPYVALAIAAPTTGLVDVALDAGLGFLSGMGKGTATGLENGLDFDEARIMGLKDGVKEAAVAGVTNAGTKLAGKVIGNVRIANSIKHGDASTAVELLQKSGKSADDIANQLIQKTGKNADEIADALLKSGKNVDDVAADLLIKSGKGADDVANQLIQKTGKNADEIAKNLLKGTGENSVDIAASVYKSAGTDTADVIAKKMLDASNKNADELASAIFKGGSTNTDDVVVSLLKKADNNIDNVVKNLDDLAQAAGKKSEAVAESILKSSDQHDDVVIRMFKKNSNTSEEIVQKMSTLGKREASNVANSMANFLGKSSEEMKKVATELLNTSDSFSDDVAIRLFKEANVGADEIATIIKNQNITKNAADIAGTMTNIFGKGNNGLDVATRLLGNSDADDIVVAIYKNAGNTPMDIANELILKNRTPKAIADAMEKGWNGTTIDYNDIATKMATDSRFASDSGRELMIEMFKKGRSDVTTIVDVINKIDADPSNSLKLSDVADSLIKSADNRYDDVVIEIMKRNSKGVEEMLEALSRNPGRNAADVVSALENGLKGTTIDFNGIATKMATDSKFATDSGRELMIEMFKKGGNDITNIATTIKQIADDPLNSLNLSDVTNSLIKNADKRYDDVVVSILEKGGASTENIITQLQKTGSRSLDNISDALNQGLGKNFGELADEIAKKTTNFDDLVVKLMEKDGKTVNQIVEALGASGRKVDDIGKAITNGLGKSNDEAIKEILSGTAKNAKDVAYSMMKNKNIDEIIDIMTDAQKNIDEIGSELPTILGKNDNETLNELLKLATKKGDEVAVSMMNKGGKSAAEIVGELTNNGRSVTEIADAITEGMKNSKNGIKDIAESILGGSNSNANEIALKFLNKNNANIDDIAELMFDAAKKSNKFDDVAKAILNSAEKNADEVAASFLNKSGKNANEILETIAKTSKKNADELADLLKNTTGKNFEELADTILKGKGDNTLDVATALFKKSGKNADEVAELLLKGSKKKAGELAEALMKGMNNNSTDVTVSLLKSAKKNADEIAELLTKGTGKKADDLAVEIMKGSSKNSTDVAASLLKQAGKNTDEIAEALINGTGKEADEIAEELLKGSGKNSTDVAKALLKKAGKNPAEIAKIMAKSKADDAIGAIKRHPKRTAAAVAAAGAAFLLWPDGTNGDYIPPIDNTLPPDTSPSPWPGPGPSGGGDGNGGGGTPSDTITDPSTVDPNEPPVTEFPTLAPSEDPTDNPMNEENITDISNGSQNDNNGNNGGNNNGGSWGPSDNEQPEDNITDEELDDELSDEDELLQDEDLDNLEDEDSIYTIPLASEGSTNQNITKNGTNPIPILAGLGLTAAAGVGAKIFIDSKKNNQNNDDNDEFMTDEEFDDLNSIDSDLIADEWTGEEMTDDSEGEQQDYEKPSFYSDTLGEEI